MVNSVEATFVGGPRPGRQPVQCMDDAGQLPQTIGVEGGTYSRTGYGTFDGQWTYEDPIAYTFDPDDQAGTVRGETVG
ncbi:hypothetical protein B7R22_17145 [Subtercola boreus]|uniref:Uncharacterized protein n=1 Tax=Subtercola boreus TaxID=120213 RepID=A0A3E0VR98_9MICO|nr:hypothetical protein B7R22_17145 [Subtercola boreus]